MSQSIPWLWLGTSLHDAAGADADADDDDDEDEDDYPYNAADPVVPVGCPFLRS